MHGVDVADPFRWLERGDDRDVRRWVAAQNRRTSRVLNALPDRGRLHRRLTELLEAGTSEACRVAGNRVFSLDRWGDHDQAVLVVRSATDPGPATILVDPAAISDDRTAALDWFHPSADGHLVAYGTSRGGDERSTLRIFDVDDQRHLPDEIPHTRAASVAWLHDDSGFAYTRYPDPDEVGEEEATYWRRVWWHEMGGDPHHDQLLFGDLPDRTAWPEVSLAPDDRWALVHVALGWSRIDLHLIDLRSGARTTLLEGEEAITNLDFSPDRRWLVGHTTLEAPRGRVVRARLERPGHEAWETIVPERDSVVEATATIRSGLLVASTLDGVAQLHHHRPDGSGRAPVDLGEPGSLLGLDGSNDRNEAFACVTSFARPPALHRWTPAEGMTPWSDLPSPVDPERYLVERTSYVSTDGAEIGLFLVSPTDLVPGPTTPAVLTGYGGFAVTMTPAWSPVAVTLCDEGGMYAVAGLRGGAERGEDWHRAGMRENKQQVFDDFIAAADWLVERGFTSRERLAIRGGSNGGLLVTAAITQRPDLCAAVHCAVPLTDMVRFPRFLLAELWVPEYGDPRVEEEFAWLLAYSPYHLVLDGACYPSVLFTTAEQDSRVDPAHARKMTARLQEATACGDRRPILFREEHEAGHGQGKPVSLQAHELTDVMAFLLWQLEEDEEDNGSRG